jgi:hypothetical protein
MTIWKKNVREDELRMKRVQGKTHSLNDLTELGETLTEGVIGSGPGKTAR